MANDLSPLATDLRSVADGLRGDAARAVLVRVGVEARKLADDHAAAALGGDRRFSGWRTGQVGVGFEFDGDTRIVIEARPNGPAVVAEDGRRRGARTARRGRYRGRRVGWGPTAGRSWWTRFLDDLDEDLPKVVEREAMTEMQRLWNG